MLELPRKALKKRGALRFLAAAFFALSFVGASCGQSVLGIMPGVLNDPGNLSLRQAILQFATSSVCAEMLDRSVPIRAHDEEPSMGRFFPASCFAQQLPSGRMLVRFSGAGYLWTNATKRLTFDANGAVEYELDFLMDGSTLYAYFRHKATNEVAFNVKVVESPATGAMLGLPIPMDASSIVRSVAPKLLKAELSRGFTVIREESGSASFGLGVIEKGQKPPAPYATSTTGRLLLANERTEIHQGQRDFTGPYKVTDDGQALYLTVSVDGAPGADVILVPAAIGQAWRDTYITTIATTPPPSPGRVDEPMVQGVMWRRTVPLPKGSYYVVFDNTATAGRTSLPINPNDDRAAAISYAVELGSAP